jgi:hypothetical protein
LEAHATNPEEARAHRRQAVLALIFGAFAWGLTLAGGLLASAAGTEGGATGGGLAGLAVMLLIPGPILAVLGVGQGATAVRQRGDQLILATIGFLLSGLYLGGVLGVLIATMRFGSGS